MGTKAIVVILGIAAVGSLGLYLYLRKKKTAQAVASTLTNTSTSMVTPILTSPTAAVQPQAALSPDQLAAIVAQQEKIHYCNYPMGSPFLSWVSQPETKIGYVQKKYGIPATGPNVFSGYASGTSFSIGGIGPSAMDRVLQLNTEYGCTT